MAKNKKKTSQKTTKKPSKKVDSGPRSASLATLRRKIDRLDREIVTKLNERAEFAREIGLVKDDAGKAVYAPEREEKVITQAVDQNRGPLSDDCIRAVYRELVSGSRSVQQALRVAFLGPEYTYSHLAAIERFGQSVELVPVGSIAAVFEEVNRRQADFGLVPLENSTDGRVTDTLEMLAKTTVKMCGEVQLPIHHNLLGRGSRADVQEVYSKPQALSQCRNWITKHLPGARTLEVASTAEAARLAGEKPGVAAIASLQAAVNHNLDVLAKNIEDNPDNITRFAVIGQESARRTGDDKTALMFEIAHRPGALADAMAIFKRGRLNMTWIESFPIPQQTGRYLFFIEFVGHQNDLRARRAIAAIEKKAVRLEVLGSYARMAHAGK